MAKKADQKGWKILLPIIGGVLLISESLKGYTPPNAGPAYVDQNGLLKGGLSNPINIVDQLPKHPDKTYGYRSLSLVNKYIWHHSAWPNGDPWLYADLHITHPDKEWPGIGYHFVIQPDGTLYQTNYLDTLSYHCSGQNMVSVGTCLTGNFENDYPTAAQMATASQLLSDLYDALGYFPSYGHNVYRPTDCPGNLSITAIESGANNILA